LKFSIFTSFKEPKNVKEKYRIFWTIQEFFSDMESSKLIRYSIDMCWSCPCPRAYVKSAYLKVRCDSSVSQNFLKVKVQFALSKNAFICMTFIIEICKDILFNLYVHANIWIDITRFLYIISNISIEDQLHSCPLFGLVLVFTTSLTPKCQLFPHPHQVFL
jgi:hypothetical protein